MQRPRVLVNMASSLDGKTNPVRSLRSGPFMMSRHAEDPARMLRIRAMAGAIVIGSGNLKADDPDLALAPDERVRRRAAGAREPLRVIVTRRADGLNANYAAFDAARGGEAVIAHALPIDEHVRHALEPVATLVEVGDGAGFVSIIRLLDWLLHARNVDVVLSEGGGTLNAAFFAARAVDSMYLTVVPRVLGGVGAPTAVDGPGFAVSTQYENPVANPPMLPDATLGDVDRAGDELFLRYDFCWPAPAATDVGGNRQT